MARYILEGDDKSVRDIIRMHKILVARGAVSFTPCEESSSDVADDDKSQDVADYDKSQDVSDTKNVKLTDTKKPTRLNKSK